MVIYFPFTVFFNAEWNKYAKKHDYKSPSKHTSPDTLNPVKSPSNGLSTLKGLSNGVTVPPNRFNTLKTPSDGLSTFRTSSNGLGTFETPSNGEAKQVTLTVYIGLAFLVIVIFAILIAIIYLCKRQTTQNDPNIDKDTSIDTSHLLQTRNVSCADVADSWVRDELPSNHTTDTYHHAIYNRNRKQQEETGSSLVHEEAASCHTNSCTDQDDGSDSIMSPSASSNPPQQEEQTEVKVPFVCGNSNIPVICAVRPPDTDLSLDDKAPPSQLKFKDSFHGHLYKQVSVWCCSSVLLCNRLDRKLIS